MALYEYRCEACGHEFEKLIRVNRAQLEVQCPKCESRQVARKLSRFAASNRGGAVSGGVSSCAPGGS